MKKNIFYIFYIVVAIGIGFSIAYFVIFSVKITANLANKIFSTSMVFFHKAEKVVSQKADIRPLLKTNFGNQNISWLVLAESPKAIFANLDEKKIYLYEKGIKINTIPIESEADKDSIWYAPPGQYKVLSKSDEHTSFINKSELSFVVQFYGNYFIGFTTSTNKVGKKTDKKSTQDGSAGSIKLTSSEDAKKLYNFASVDVPIIISRDSNIHNQIFQNSFYGVIDPSKSFPKTSTRSYLIGDLETGKIIFEKKPDIVVPIASLTKLTTSIVALQKMDLNAKAGVSLRAKNTLGNSGDLKIGEELTVAELLYPLLLESSNDAAEVIAEKYGRVGFLNEMNRVAENIGMKDSYFVDPSGLNNLSVSTANDLFKELRYLYKNHKEIFDITKKINYQIPKHRWVNINSLSKIDNYIGGKTGYTSEAMHTNVAIFSLSLSEFRNNKIVIIVLGSRDGKNDIKNFLSYIQKNIYFDGNDMSVIVAEK